MAHTAAGGAGKPAAPERIAIGIDLGTTNSCVAVWRHGAVQVLSDASGERTVPSVVAFTDVGAVVGEAAKKQPLDSQVYSIKRIIGRNMADSGVKEDAALWPFKVVEGDKGRARVQVHEKGATKTLAPEEISGRVLAHLKQMAEAFFGGKPVTEAVITVPAYFNGAQKEATLFAAQLAGLKVLKLISEPCAAALAFLVEPKSASACGGAGGAAAGPLGAGRNVVVFDLGGGTLDVTVGKTLDDCLEVLAHRGNNHLGGDDFDNTLIAHCNAVFQKENPALSIRENATAQRRLKVACEDAKKRLSASLSVTVEVAHIIGDVSLKVVVTRKEFEGLNKASFETAIGEIAKALADAKLAKSAIHEVILVGGSARIPMVQSLVQAFFDGKKLNVSLNPDEAVAVGAAIHAATLAGMVGAPAIDVSDVTPLSLGIETDLDGKFTAVVKHGTTIPVSRTRNFTTIVDDQTTVTFKVFEGERPLAKDNQRLGSFEIKGIPKLPKGKPVLKCTFEIDASNVLVVTAVEESTGTTNFCVITNDERPTPAEVAVMVANAAKYKAADAVALRRSDAQSNVEQMLDGFRKRIEAATPKLSKAELLGVNAYMDAQKAFFASSKDAAAAVAVDEIEAMLVSVPTYLGPQLAKVKC